MMDIAIIATDLALYFKWVFLLTLTVAVAVVANAVVPTELCPCKVDRCSYTHLRRKQIS